MDDPAYWHRLQFAFTITYHYLFPQLTMGLAWFLVIWKWRHFKYGDEVAGRAVRFWSRIFGINFALGVVTGVPMEFQFGTNWAEFTRYAGGVVGQTLALEGMFAFFMESAFIGALVFGEKKLGPRGHLIAAIGVAVGSWLSAYFILVTNAFMQHPVGHGIAADGTLVIESLAEYLNNPWAWIQFAHNQAAALVTGSFVVAAIGAYYTLRGIHRDDARLYLRWGTVGRTDLVDARDLPDRRCPSEAGGPVSRARARRHGRAIRERPLRRDHADRPTERSGAPPRQSDSHSRRLELSRHRAVSRRRARAECISRRAVADQRGAPLLLFPRDGGTRHDLRRW